MDATHACIFKLGFQPPRMHPTSEDRGSTEYLLQPTIMDDDHPAKGHVSFAATTAGQQQRPKTTTIGITIDRNYGGCAIASGVKEDPTMEHLDDDSQSSSGGSDLPQPHTPVPPPRHEALNAARRRTLESTRSMRHGSLRDLRNALGRQPSVMSIYSPLEVRRVDGGLSPRSLTCVVINLISAGYILLPYAFAQGGVVLSTVVLLLVAFQTCVSGSFLLVAGAHAEALNNHKSLGGTLPVNYSFALRNRKYEVSHLYRIFMSRFEALFFTATTIGDMFGITLALITIFATTLAERAPMGSEDVDSYRLYLLIFVCVAIPMSCTSIIDQVWVQLVFLTLRMLMVLLMLVTIFAAMGHSHFGSLKGPVDDIPLADFRNVIPIVMTSIFSTAYQFSVPCIAASSKNIKTVPQVFQAATTFVYVSNVMVAIFVSFYFGRDGTLPSSNLMWNDYHGGVGATSGTSPWWATFISSYVTLFAAIDGAAVYPLLAIALGDILMGSVYGNDVHAAEENWKIRIFFRMLGALPQALTAVFVSDLSVIAKYAGICTLFSYTTAPALLFLHSRKRAHDAKISSSTHYSSCLSSPVVAWTMITLSFGIVAGVIADALI